MEELVGEFWHKLITRQASTDYIEARVSFDSVQHQLGPYYRALGGIPGKTIDISSDREIHSHRRLLQRMAGTHRRFHVAWQNERSLCLPPTIALFPERQLNESLYFWLTALAAFQPEPLPWFKGNQQAIKKLLDARPGLKKIYYDLVQATIKTRPHLKKLEGRKLAREQAIRQALKQPGTIETLPKAKGEPLPVFLWLYPAPLYEVSVTAEDELEHRSDDSAPAATQTVNIRKEAKRVDDQRETDGLLVFMLDSLFSWTEQVELDRPQEEDVDGDSTATAEDVDIISLSRQRRASAAKIKFDMDLPAPQNDDLALGEGRRLPEWDYRKQLMKPNYCLLQPMLADDAQPREVPEYLRADARALRNRFSALNFQYSWQRKQSYGNELDLDACVDARCQPGARSERQDLYRNRSRTQRDLSCLLLADLSMSTDSGINSDQRVIDVIRDSIMLFAEAMDSAGDPFAIYGFSSIKNKQVRYHLLKNFAEPYSDACRGRIMAIKPGYYTRMGAAIRQSAEILKTQSSEQKLLLILSDGKPNDIDYYEGRYGIEDTRRAINEARRDGLRPFCITIDDKGNDYLPYLFGDQGYAIISDIARMPGLLPKLYLNLTDSL